MQESRMQLAADTIAHDRYRIGQMIGKGGMGAVYEALDLRLSNPVALKQMLVVDPRSSRAFEREAKLLAKLRHPVLPKVIDYFSQGDDLFLVMEFIPGDNLADLLAQRHGPFPVEEVLSWADQLLSALDYLHTQQPSIIHRDIKPQNLKLMPNGEIILLDFGLAKGAPMSQSQDTSERSLFGYTRQYAPLEQIRGAGTDPCSDLYALAGTLHALLVGTPPIGALARSAAKIDDRPDPLQPAHELNPQVPAAVGTVSFAKLG